MAKFPYLIAVDFDGTLFEHSVDGTLKVGPEVPGAIDAVKSFQEAGASIILWTVRSDESLGDARAACSARGLGFYGINELPGQREWSRSPKVFARVYIDDATYGAPLIFPGGDRRPYFDWEGVAREIINRIHFYNLGN